MIFAGVSLPRRGKRMVYHGKARSGAPRRRITSQGNIYLAPAMTDTGARGKTEQQGADTLHFALAQGRLCAAPGALDSNSPTSVKRPGMRSLPSIHWRREKVSDVS
jgi:hypothetical protein